MTFSEIGERLECEVIGVIPQAPQASVVAQEAGSPLVLNQPDSVVAASLREVANRLAWEADAGIGQPQRPALSDPDTTPAVRFAESRKEFHEKTQYPVHPLARHGSIHPAIRAQRPHA